jgi:GST-like protein
MIKFFYNPAPNPLKIALFLEETGLEYELTMIDSKLGDQHSDEFRSLNPNAKVPVIVDDGKVVFDSNAILLYLAEKTGRFLADKSGTNRGELLSWLMFVASGVGPFSGQAVHFRHFAVGSNPYSVKRYNFEARRHWRIVDERLADRKYMLGDEYSIIDMSVWGWGTRIAFMLGDDAMEEYPNLARLMEEIDARPAAHRANALKDRHTFKVEMDDAAMRNMYPQIFADDGNAN